ncbi:MAG: hypothetical protein ACRC9X_01520 [Bacteroidales bacterium]
MKHQNLLKQIVLCTMMLFSLNSCIKDGEVNGGGLELLYVPTVSFSSSTAQSDNAQYMDIALSKVKELGYISHYKYETLPPRYNVFTIFFKRENVAEAQEEAVKAELIKEAKEHYEKATKEVNAFNFQTLYSAHLEQMFFVNFQIHVLIDGADYKVNVTAGNPLITDKTWACSEKESPIKTIDWEEGNAKVTFADGSVENSTKYHRGVSGFAFVVGTFQYEFKIKSLQEIQLVTKKNTEDASSESFKDKNYLFR